MDKMVYTEGTTWMRDLGTLMSASDCYDHVQSSNPDIARQLWRQIMYEFCNRRGYTQTEFEELSWCADVENHRLRKDLERI